MEQWFYRLEDLPPGAVLVAGTFDGVHLGHEAIFAAARAEAAKRGQKPWIFSFLGHPAQILHPEAVPGALQDEAMQLWSLHREGAHHLMLEPFTRDFAELSAAAFAERLRGATLFCGEDWRFGKGAEGSADFLRARGFDVRVIPYAVYKGQRISSTRIREALQAGQMHDVAQMLGRPWCYCGPIVHGRGLAGKSFGVPTCNIPYVAQGAQPLAPLGYGVYAATATLLPPSGATETYPAVVNFGVAPTIKDDPLPQFEAHLFGAYGDYYGSMVQLSFAHDRLRPEQSFASIDALKQQIVLDARACCQQLGVAYQ